MKTPKSYIKNLENNIITDEMLSDALFSVNKRAKNWRDRKRECRASRYAAKYAYSAEAKENEMYVRKNKLLKLLKPVCIHKETQGYERIRVYEYDKDYYKKMLYYSAVNNIAWVNRYATDGYDITEFFDFNNTNCPIYKYYLYYVLGEHSYHIPINESNISKYNNLEVECVSTIIIEGRETDDLLSVQFVDKMLVVIKSGKYSYTHDKSFDNYKSSENFSSSAIKDMNDSIFIEVCNSLFYNLSVPNYKYELSDKEKLEVKNNLSKFIIKSVERCYKKSLKKSSYKCNLKSFMKSDVNNAYAERFVLGNYEAAKKYIRTTGLKFKFDTLCDILCPGYRDREINRHACKKYALSCYESWFWAVVNELGYDTIIKK